MKLINAIVAALLACFIISPIANVHAQTYKPVVHAILFYSPTCPHCEYVINETLLPLIDKYGDQLQIVGIDVTQQEGQTYFLSATDTFNLSEAGVPFLVIDNMYLMGSTDIPEKFPGIAETYLAQGGVELTTIPGLTETLKNKNEAEPTPASDPVVHAVMFYRSGCSHCVKITEEVIPPLLQKYGNQLEIFDIDISLPEGDALYNAAIDKFKIETFGVPTLILGDQVLVGGAEIEEKFAGMIEGYLSQGGMDWPDIPKLDNAIAKAAEAEDSLAAQTPTVSPTDSESAVTQAEDPDILLTDQGPTTWTDRFRQDLAGNSLAVVVLLGTIGSLVWTISIFNKIDRSSIHENPFWIIPLLCAIGFGVAGYLTYVETTNVTAVCGPVGDCNTVQQSEYARLFGVLPIGIVGLFGYAAIFTSWLVAHFSSARFANLASMSIFVMTASGTLFSIYLTFLEPFVIGATCAWCLTSAILMTLLMLLAITPAKAAMRELPIFSSPVSRSGQH